MSNIRERRQKQDATLTHAYSLCMDYDYLRMALDRIPVFGVVDYGPTSSPPMRDVVMIRKHSDTWYQAGARGICYCESFDGWEEFVEQARKYNLAYVIPHNLPTAPEGGIAMPTAKNCLSCKWEPEFHKASSPGSKYGWEEVGHCNWMAGEEWPDSFRSLVIKKEHEGLRITFTCEDEEGISFITNCPAHTPKHTNTNNDSE